MIIWYDIRLTALPKSGYVLVDPTYLDVPEIWAAELFLEAQQRGPVPGWKDLFESTKCITHWAHVNRPGDPASTSLIAPDIKAVVLEAIVTAEVGQHGPEHPRLHDERLQGIAGEAAAKASEIFSRRYQASANSKPDSSSFTGRLKQ